MSEARAYAPRVTMTPATLNRFTAMPIANTRKRRVAAYARVSTNQEEQLTSYEAQVDYYTQYIHSKTEWEFVKVYTDEGISATNTKKRDGFNDMVQDALDGKIDLIITKSVSRFARNTVDSLTTVRMLKERGVEVYFEKENIYTLDSKGELLITIMSSLAQEESRSISENVTWGKRKKMADGKVNLPYKHFLGYRKGEDGLPEIVPEEAVIVKDIFRMFLEGKSPAYIARHLTERGIPTPGGKPNWRPNTVESILTNEKYKGDALLQKTFCTDFLTKKFKVNEGEVPQYYVEGSHPAIIEPEIFDAVQVELKRRKQQGRQKLHAALLLWPHLLRRVRRDVWQQSVAFPYCVEMQRKGISCSPPAPHLPCAMKPYRTPLCGPSIRLSTARMRSFKSAKIPCGNAAIPPGRRSGWPSCTSIWRSSRSLCSATSAPMHMWQSIRPSICDSTTSTKPGSMKPSGASPRQRRTGKP